MYNFVVLFLIAAILICSFLLGRFISNYWTDKKEQTMSFEDELERK